MTTQHTPVTTTVGQDIVSTPLFDEIGEPDISKSFWQNVETRSGLDITVGTIIESIGPSPGESESIAQNTSASLELNFDEEIESGVTQEVADSQQQLPAFLSYNEEDILNVDAVIVTPPPRVSRTIRVKLIYEEPSKPIPVEDPWE